MARRLYMVGMAYRLCALGCGPRGPGSTPGSHPSCKVAGMTRLSTEAMRIYMASRRSERQQRLRELLGNRCIACSSTMNLQFDHVDPDTMLFSINGRALDLRWEILLAEAVKCQLLCLDCHVVKSRIEQRARFAIKLAENPRAHGTYSKYRKEHCRCEPCVANYKTKRRQWRGNALTKVSQDRL